MFAGINMRRGINKGAIIARVLKLNKVNPNKTKILKIENQSDVEKAHELLALVKARIESRKGYCRLAGLSTFFIIYVTMLVLQQNIGESFSVESRYVRQFCSQKTNINNKKTESCLSEISFDMLLQRYNEQHHGITPDEWTGRVFQCWRSRLNWHAYFFKPTVAMA